jgi:hypothetical protein
MRVEQGVDVLEEVVLQGAEERCGCGHGSPERLDAWRVLVQGHDSGEGLFMTFIVTDDRLQFDGLQFDAQRGASPGWSSRERHGVILCAFVDCPQHPPARHPGH